MGTARMNGRQCRDRAVLVHGRTWAPFTKGEIKDGSGTYEQRIGTPHVTDRGCLRKNF